MAEEEDQDVYTYEEFMADDRESRWRILEEFGCSEQLSYEHFLEQHEDIIDNFYRSLQLAAAHNFIPLLDKVTRHAFIKFVLENTTIDKPE